MKERYCGICGKRLRRYNNKLCNDCYKSIRSQTSRKHKITYKCLCLIALTLAVLCISGSLFSEKENVDIVALIMIFGYGIFAKSLYDYFFHK